MRYQDTNGQYVDSDYGMVISEVYGLLTLFLNWKEEDFESIIKRKEKKNLCFSLADEVREIVQISEIRHSFSAW